MKLTFKIILSIAFMLCSSLALFAADNLEKPNVLGEENILTSQRLSLYKTIIIKDFSVKDTAYENIDDDEKKEVDTIKDTLPKIISAKAANKIKESKTYKNILINSGIKTGAVILEGKITKLSGGNGAAKFFLGWMAPQSAKTHIEISGKLIDASTGKVLAEFSDVKAGATGATMGFVKEVLVNLAGDEGEELADFVIKLF